MKTLMLVSTIIIIILIAIFVAFIAILFKLNKVLKEREKQTAILAEINLNADTLETDKTKVEYNEVTLKSSIHNYF